MQLKIKSCNVNLNNKIEIHFLGGGIEEETTLCIISSLIYRISAIPLLESIRLRKGLSKFAIPSATNLY